MWGDRVLYYENKACWIYKEHGLKSYLEFGKVQKQPKSEKYTEALMKGRKDGFRGKIWKVNPKKFKDIPFGKKIATDNYKKVRDAFDEKDLAEEISTFCGNYLDGLEFDAKEYWNLKTSKVPHNAYWQENPLPSDSRFREDLIWLYYGDRQLGAKWKTEMESVNRRDRGIRIKGLEA